METPNSRSDEFILPRNARARDLNRNAPSASAPTTIADVNPKYESLLGLRLAKANIDTIYLSNFETQVMQNLEQACAACAHWQACCGDMHEDMSRVEAYCSNTPVIDFLMLQRYGGMAR